MKPANRPAKTEVNRVAALGRDKSDTRPSQVQDKAKNEVKQIPETKQGQDNVIQDNSPQTKDSHLKDRKITKGQATDNKNENRDTEQAKKDVDSKAKAKELHDAKLDNKENAGNSKVVNSKDDPKVEISNKYDVKEVNDQVTNKPIKSLLPADSGRVNNPVSNTEGIKQAFSTTGNVGQPSKQKDKIEQMSIAKTAGGQADSGVGKKLEESRQSSHDKDTNQVQMVTNKTKDKDQNNQARQTNQTDKVATDKTQKEIEDKSDNRKQTLQEKENGMPQGKAGSENGDSNKHKTTKGTRGKHRLNTSRRKYDGDDEESDDVEDQLEMDNELVKHLLPHMSPALLPKAMQQPKGRDDSSNSSEEETVQTKKVSLNVIKESEGEESEEGSDDEPPARPPPSFASSRRHSFHHFPAPPTESQSKNAEKVRALLQAVEDEELEKISKKLGEKTDLVKQHIGHVENRLFEMFGNDEKKTININKFLMGLTATGMRPTDPRLKQTRDNLKKLQENMGSEFVSLEVDYDTFMGIISENLEVVIKAFSAGFVIPDFQGFCKQIEDIYDTCYNNHSGKPAQYIPQLARFDSKSWGVAICTVDGQRFSLGDVDSPFTIQSCSKPLTYAIGLAVNGTDYMHNYVGMEPSGRYFNELILDYSNKPHNPMINAGAMMTAAIIKPELSAADRFDFMFKVYKRLVGDEYLGFNNSVFLSERECADRNFALAYFMRENKCFPPNHKLQESLDFYFQLCSLEITAESGAVMAATLANGGLNPLTGDPVLTADAIRNTLTLMHSCGMYNYSGQFAFHVGLPAKSGVSGCVLLVIPNTMGICLWSPPLDSNGNSCRGVQFCMEMVSRFNFHNFDNLRGFTKSKQDPRTAKTESKAQILFDLLFSSAAGDMSAIRRHSLAGTDMQAKDYDGRTALHVATSEGHQEIVEFLLNNCHVDPLPKDRWDRTPLDDAESFDHSECARLITESCKKRGINLPLSYKSYIKLTKQPNGPKQSVTSS